MLTTDAQVAVRQVNSVKIGLVKDNSVKTGKPGGEGGGGFRIAQ